MQLQLNAWKACFKVYKLGHLRRQKGDWLHEESFRSSFIQIIPGEESEHMDRYRGSTIDAKKAYTLWLLCYVKMLNSFLLKHARC